MLEYLRIRDLALIEDMELGFSDGLNVLTGETGAGKSFILKALNFLLGDKLEASMVRPGHERATAEALFALPDKDLILRRELLAGSGRSRLFINDQLASQESARDLRPTLVLHTSQHGQQKLLQPAFQSQLLDSFMNQPELPAACAAQLEALRALAARRNDLESRVRELTDRREMLEFQQREIDAVDPEPGEEERLESLRLALREHEAAQAAQDEALGVLRGDSDAPGLSEQLLRLERALARLTALDAPDGEDNANNEWADYSAQFESFRHLLPSLDQRLRKRPVLSLPDGSSIRPDELEHRLFALSQLKRKLKRSMEDILNLRAEIRENLSFLDACGLDLLTLDREEADLAAALAQTLETLNAARQETAQKLSAALETDLAGLGFSEHVRVRFEFAPHEIWPTPRLLARKNTGAPCVEQRPRLLWIPNPGQSPQPLDRIASGGELSRFLLAVTGLTANNEHATLVFDEIDAGVGGLTLNHMADRLTHLAAHRQILLITHWPQLAARATRHFQVAKHVQDNETFTICRALTPAEIPDELARMAGGGAQGAALAKELTGK